MFIAYNDSGEVLINTRATVDYPYDLEINEKTDLPYEKDNAFYSVVSDNWTPKTPTEVEAIKAQRIADGQEEMARLDELEVEAVSDGMKTYTVEQIDNYLDGVYDPTEFDAATTVADIKAAIKTIFTKQKQLDRRLALRVAVK